MAIIFHVYIHLNSRLGELYKYKYKYIYIYIYLIGLKFKRECSTSPINHIIFTLRESIYPFQIIWNQEKYVIQQQQHQ